MVDLAALLDQRIAFVGTAGAGKTYAAKGMVELAIKADARVCVVDPLGVWWGLRLAIDGKTPGLKVLILGGLHGDVPINEHNGAAVARLVASGHFQGIVDVSELGSNAAVRRFMTAFAEAIYDTNKSQLHLVLDEADKWSPQRPGPDAMALQGRISEIVRRGRVRGFVPWLITQRPAVLDKDVLSQADVLIALKLTSSQDRNAIGAWIEGQADRAQEKDIMAALPKLQRGTGFVWAPTDGILERVQFPGIATFDSSRTPKRGEVMEHGDLPPVDASAALAALAVPAEKPAKTALAKDRYDEGFATGARSRDAEVLALHEKLQRQEAAIREAGFLLLRHVEDIKGGVALIPPQAGPPTIDATPVQRQRQTPAPTVFSGGGGAEKRILRVLALRHPAKLTEAQWATLAGMKRTGGTWGTYKSRLRVAGHIMQDGPLYGVTPAALAMLGTDVPAPQTRAETLAMWSEAVGGGAGRMLETIAAAGSLTRAALADKTGMTESGGTFGTYLSRLKSNGLIETEGKTIWLSDVFDA